MSQVTPSVPPPRGDAPRHALGARPRHLLGLLSTWIVALLPANLVPSIIGLAVDELGVPLTVAGAVATGMTLANAAGVLGMRPVVSRGHRVVVARGGVVLLATPLLVAAIWTVAPVVMTAFVVAGLGSGALIAAATASAAGTQDPDRVATAIMTVNRVIVAASFLLLPLLGGGIRGILWLLIGFAVLAFLGSAWLSQREEAALGAPEQVLTVSPAQDVAGSRVIAWFLAVLFAVWTVSEEGIYAVLAVLMSTNLPALDPDAVYLYLAAGVFAGILGAVASEVFRRLLGRTGAIAVVLGLSVLAKVGLLFITVDGLYLAALIVWGFAFGATIPLVFGMAAKLSVSGSANVLVNGVYVIGVALGPLVATQLAELGGLPLLEVVIPAISVLAAIALVVVAARSRRVIEATDAARAAVEG